MKTTLRLDRLLSNLGYGSRREVQILLARGRVALDGRMVKDGDLKVKIEEEIRARLTVDGEGLDPLPGITLLMNKPLGFTCSHREKDALVYELLPERWQKREPPLATVGRLDKDTSGLLLITDDGPLLHRITSPKKLIAKRYRAELARPLRGGEGDEFASGEMMLEGESKPLLPAQLEVVGPREAILTIREGRYHQVRRMFAAVGNHVNALRRESIGGLALPADLAPGEFRMATADEVARVFAG